MSTENARLQYWFNISGSHLCNAIPTILNFYMNVSSLCKDVDFHNKRGTYASMVTTGVISHCFHSLAIHTDCFITME